MTTNSASGVGSSSITTLGTISTGVWNGTAIDLAHGGTNANLTASNGGIFYSTGSAGAILAGTATANQILLSGSSTTPAWSTATFPASTTANQLLYSSATNTIGGLATANSAVLVTNSTGVPAWSGTMTNGQIIIGSTSGTPTAATLTAGTNVTITNAAGSITIASTGGGGGTGTVSQIVTTSSTTATSSSTVISRTTGSLQNTDGVQLVTLAITPKSATSTLIIEFHCPLVGNTAGVMPAFGLFQDTTVSALTAAIGYSDSVSRGHECTFRYVMTSGTTSATTFKVRYGPLATGTMSILKSEDGTITLGSLQYSLTITEIAP